MAELKDTIKALEVCREMDNPPGWRTATCEDCPYHGDGCARKLKEDAAELLKTRLETEKKKWHVVPVVKMPGRNRECHYYECPACGEEIVFEQKYCSGCGKPIKWD